MKIEGTGIPPVSGSGEPVRPVRGRKGTESQTGTAKPDGVEISAMSRALAELAAMNDVREELVAKVIAQLDAGEYMDAEKLRAAIRKMLSIES